MDAALADGLDWLADALAAIAVFGALFATVLGSSNPKIAEVPSNAPYLAFFGVVIFLVGRVLRYHFAGY